MQLLDDVTQKGRGTWAGAHDARVQRREVERGEPRVPQHVHEDRCAPAHNVRALRDDGAQSIIRRKALVRHHNAHVVRAHEGHGGQRGRVKDGQRHE